MICGHFCLDVVIFLPPCFAAIFSSNVKNRFEGFLKYLVYYANLDGKYLASYYRLYCSVIISNLSCASNTATLCISITIFVTTILFSGKWYCSDASTKSSASLWKWCAFKISTYSKNKGASGLSVNVSDVLYQLQ